MDTIPSSLKDQSPAFYDGYWQHVQDSYALYPTIRHRRRFIISVLRRLYGNRPFTLFDFGCGNGRLLRELKEEFHLPSANVGGSDISEEAVTATRAATGSTSVFHAAYPETSELFDAVICSEVIEHTERYAEILTWIYAHLAPGGRLLLTTQTGRIHACDCYTGHTQHFQLRPLVALLRSIGYSIHGAREWGFPLFTLQKYLTNVSFESIRTTYLEGGVTRWKKFVFDVAYALYFFHDLLPIGPQIYVVAGRDATAAVSNPASTPA